MSCAGEPPRRLSDPRRALFPTAEDDDSDLGHMSPIGTDQSSSDSESATDRYYFKSMKNHSVNDYDILGDIHKNEGHDLDDTPMQKKVLSPERAILASEENTIIPDTPIKESPALRLETPHDNTTQNAGLPKLARKPQLDDVDESPERKLPKPDQNKSSKVRTALFPVQELTVSVKSFYARTGDLRFGDAKRFVDTERVKRKRKSEAVYLCSRKSKRNRFGQINTGVRHKIKKPKQRKPTKTQLLKAAISLIENSPLNEYLEELKQLQNKPKIIKPIAPEQRTLELNKKREHSPEPDGNNRKFFKSHGDIQVEIRGHDLAFTKKQQKSLDHTFDLDDTNLVDNSRIAHLIDVLEDDKENQEAAQPPPKRQKLELLSPISQMCDTTSGLALNSPKKARNLTTVLQNMAPPPSCFMKIPAVADMEGKPKLFSVFDMGTNRARKEERGTKGGGHARKWKALPANQMLLDAGQKRFGPTQCPECEIVYHMGDPSEEIMHLNYHNAGSVLRFNGWKNEEVLVDFLDARVIRVKPNDSKIWWKKVSALLEVVNKDLGYYDAKMNTEHSHVYLYIKNKTIAGCLVAERRVSAHRKLNQEGADLCSEESYPIKCGVSRIWVSHNYRRRGIATILMDSLKANFVYGYVLGNEDIAFSSPTDMGHNFAKKYFKTGEYLIYM